MLLVLFDVVKTTILFNLIKSLSAKDLNNKEMSNEEIRNFNINKLLLYNHELCNRKIIYSHARNASYS